LKAPDLGPTWVCDWLSSRALGAFGVLGQPGGKLLPLSKTRLPVAFKVAGLRFALTEPDGC
jgi:hypothetical protein